MSVSITVRNVPDDVRNELASRAAGAGRSFQSYLLDLLRREASARPIEEVLAAVRAGARATGVPVDVNELLSALDEERER